MKTKFAFFVAVSCCFLIFSCEKETTMGVSKITTFPTIRLNGDRIINHPIGTPFQDPGAVGKEGTKDAQVSVQFARFSEGKFTPLSSIPTSVPGVYQIKYTAVNVDGFKISDARYVGIVSEANKSRDISGTYRRNTNTTTFPVTKLGNGHYSANNIGGVPGRPEYIFDFQFFNTNGDTIVGPPQPGVNGKEVYVANAKITDTGFQWSVIDGPTYFGAVLRVFLKL